MADDIQSDEIRYVTTMLNAATAERLLVEVVHSFGQQMRDPDTSMLEAAVAALNACGVSVPNEH